LPKGSAPIGQKVNPPIRATSVRFNIGGGRGGAFKVFGVKCIDPDDKGESPTTGLSGVLDIPNHKAIKPLFDIKDDRIVSLLCSESLSNTKKLSHIKMKTPNTVTVYCNDSCVNTPFAVYGYQKYTKDSAICRAAAHSDMINPDNRKVEIKFEDPLKSYVAENKNGIPSQAKPKSDLTISFNKVVDEDEIKLIKGSKVDLKNPDPKSDQKILLAIIQKIDIRQGANVLTVRVEGTQKDIEITYPSKNSLIMPCGSNETTKNRDCIGSRKNPNVNRPVTISFIQADRAGKPLIKPLPGELVDFGESFGKVKNQAYGWNKDMTGQVKLIDAKTSWAIFNAWHTSDLCQSKPAPNCDPVEWRVKAGFGSYIVKIWVGSPKEEVRGDIRVNDVVVVSGTVDAGQTKVFEQKVESIDQYLVFTTFCETNCSKHQSKMNKVEISPFKDVEDIKREDQNKVTGPKAKVCGGWSGGECDKVGGDPLHCVYTDMQTATPYCGQNNAYKIVSLTPTCPSGVVCVKIQYSNSTECQTNCPGKKCNKTNVCLA
jgi:hypothetical protein